MTILQKVAQMVRDLKVLNVLDRRSFIEFSYKEDSYTLRIVVELPGAEQCEEKIRTIEKVWLEEFPKEFFDVIDLYTNQMTFAVKFKSL